MKKVFFSLMCVSAMLLTLVSCNKNEKPDDGGGTTPTEKKALATPSIQISEQTENSFTVTWGEVANAASYKVAFDGTESDVTETSKKFEGLEAGEYTVKVKAVAAADSKEYKDSEWAESKVTIEGTPARNPWLGTWTLTSDKVIVAELIDTEEGQTVQYSEPKEETLTMELTIGETELQSQDGPVKVLEIMNFSPVFGDQLPAFAQFDETSMYVLSGISFQADEEGWTPMWIALCDTEEGQQLVTGAGIQFTLNQDETEATGVWDSGKLQDGTAFTTLMLEIFAVQGNSWAPYGQDFPYKYPTGNVTLTKKSSAAAAPANVPAMLPAVKGPVSFAR